MSAVRRLVLDVLKPQEPPLVEFTRQIASLDGVEGATGSLLELDRDVQNVEVAVTGERLDVDAVFERVAALGASVHSVDRVSCGRPQPPSDRHAPEGRWAKHGTADRARSVTGADDGRASRRPGSDEGD